MTQVANDLAKHQWSIQPQAAVLVQELIDEFLRRCPEATRFADRLLTETGTRFNDWVEAIVDPFILDRHTAANRLREVGYELDPQFKVWRHPQAMFPIINLVDAPKTFVMLKVESVVDFLAANGLADGRRIEEPPLAHSRHVFEVFGGDKAAMGVVERNGGLFEKTHHEADPATILRVGEMFRLRRRKFDSERQGFEHAMSLVDEAKKLVGVSRACRLFFAGERGYWMSRNKAARVQYARQQALGMGWANHDHHTYRSSRECFKDLVAVLENLGLICRERFYAGREAGWGAQVMENPHAGIVVFADVDLNPEEVTGDFSHAPLPPRKQLGTVGLWCKLHGEAFLQAGMHHLECQFDFNAAREQLKKEGVSSMKPFTDFDYLKQAFTEGEVWAVDPKRVEAALREGFITAEQADKFRREGALGSHLEVLQRDDGYKGFNQTGISEIIRKTDPRYAGVGQVRGA